MLAARSELIAVVLAGGGSRRMGSPKHALELGGESLLERTLRTLRPLRLELLVAAGEHDVPDSRDFDRCADGEGAGPAAGLLGAANARPSRPLLAVACDLPFLSTAFLRELLRLWRAGTADVLIPQTTEPRGVRLHPLTAIYGPRAIERLRMHAAAGRYSLHALAEPEAALEVSSPSHDALGLSAQQLEGILFNCNRSSDWERAQRLFRQ